MTSDIPTVGTTPDLVAMTRKTIPNLLPCPFCGMHMEYRKGEVVTHPYWEHPKNLDCFHDGLIFDDRAEVIERWNRRAYPTCCKCR